MHPLADLDDPSVLLQSFDRLSDAFANFTEKHDLTVMAAGADKHGSYTWEAGRRDEDLTRYIGFWLTFKGAGDAREGDRLLRQDSEGIRSSDSTAGQSRARLYEYTILLWNGADDGQRFIREDGPSATVTDWGAPSYTLLESVPRELGKLWLVAENLTRHDLKEWYVVPRKHRQGEPAHPD